MEGNDVCGHCLKKVGAKTCSRCRSLVYCSKECQAKHWKAEHKHTCKSYKPLPIKKLKTCSQFTFIPSTDTNRNLLLMFHGLGDTHQQFSQLARKFNFMNTACLVVQATNPLPLNLGFGWHSEFESDGTNIVPHPDEKRRTASLCQSRLQLEAVIQELDRLGWEDDRISLFGYGQGSAMALELAFGSKIPCCRAVYAKGQEFILREYQSKIPPHWHPNSSQVLLVTDPGNNQQQHVVQNLEEFLTNDQVQFHVEDNMKLLGDQKQARRFFEFHSRTSMSALEELAKSDETLHKVEQPAS